MRSIKMFGHSALGALAAMAFVGATSASAETSTQLCNTHTSLTSCGSPTSSVHQVLAAGTVGKILGSFLNILCLNVLVEYTVLGLGKPQSLHATSLSFTGCGSNSAHDNCTLTTEELPLSHLLKTGLDEGVLLNTSGRVRLQCGSINCVLDPDGSEFAVGGGHTTADEALYTELGGKLVCPGDGTLDWLLESLSDTYILG